MAKLHSVILSVFLVVLVAPGVAKDWPRPAVIKTTDLMDFEALPEARRKLVKAAIDLAARDQWFKYTFGSADPKNGGFDCSGAMYFLLSGLKYEPARSSAGQYLWIRDAERLTKVGEGVKTIEDKVFETLKPGDLVFWSGTYAPEDGRKVKVTHVGIYLGKEKKDGRPVMACSTDGRSYRGRRSNGYGIYDLRVPAKTSRSKLVAFGTPPISEEE